MRNRSIAALVALLATLGCGSFKRWSYDGFGRDAWQKPDEVIALLAIAPGAQVADIGAGGGYFSFRLADAVGPEGRVYAVDVDEDMLSYLEERVREEARGNVEVVRAAFDDPRLPDGRIDLVFSCNTYHHLSDRTAYFARLRSDLAPGARVAILELNGNSWFARTFGHMTPKQEIVSEVEAAGYRLVGDHDLVEQQHFLVFEVAS
jgi:ubiquinone/menaquinone biosynthesis C-methylase UbiE